MKKPVSLSVHKNTLEGRRKRELAKDMRGQVESIIRECDVRAYAFVAIDANGGAHCRFDTGAFLPLWGFPSTVAAVIQREIENEEIADDWRPSLPIRGTE